MTDGVCSVSASASGCTLHVLVLWPWRSSLPLQSALAVVGADVAVALALVLWLRYKMCQRGKWMHRDYLDNRLRC